MATIAIAPAGIMSRVEIDGYVLDTLMADLVGHDRQPSAFLVYLRLWRHTHGSGHSTAQVSLLDLAVGTGLSKRAVHQRSFTHDRRPWHRTTRNVPEAFATV